MNRSDADPAYAPLFEADSYSAEEREQLAPFFSNLDQSVYAPLVLSPEVIGALCSRTSRAADDLRKVFLAEYLTPFLQPDRGDEDDEEWAQKAQYSEDLKAFTQFLREHPLEQIFSNPRARSFYSKWLAQYGDDSIAQMAGMHLVYSSISNVAIKHFQDQRIGIAPIEKSTRYVDYSEKVNGQYRYYVDPQLARHGLEDEYRAAMDNLFDTYFALKPKLSAYLAKAFPDERAKVVETKAFDTLRGLLPMATLSQVAFFGNGQAFEYLVARSLKHPLGEIRWAGERAYDELYKVAPSFLRRVKDNDSERRAVADSYQEYKAGLPGRLEPVADKLMQQTGAAASGGSVELVEYDPDGEAKVLTGLLYNARGNHQPWSTLFEQVKALPDSAKEEIIAAALAGRDQRWQKVPRALENAYVRFDIAMNIGAWRDIHRHRMLTQERQYFTCQHGYDVPPELTDAKLDGAYREALDRAAAIHHKIAQHDTDLAQYAVPLAFRVRFMQWSNLRECFWEMELRTIPEGHPDYRKIEQEKFKLLAKVYPLITKYMRVNLENYDFARRGQEEKIQAKLAELEQLKT